MGNQDAALTQFVGDARLCEGGLSNAKAATTALLLPQYDSWD